MDFHYTEEEVLFRQEVRDFIQRNETREVRLETDSGVVRGPQGREFMRKLAEAGLLGISWPKEHGGKEMSPIYEFILNDELAYAMLPHTGKGVGIIGRTIMKRGNDWQKKELLPRILRGEVEFALGYTEPEAGSDLAALRLGAAEEGDDYLVNGQKCFTSSADVADWVWLLARTDPNLPKHKGLSLFVVDLKSPGITITRLETMGDRRTNEVFYDNVRVPKRCLVGKANEGWLYAAEALSTERAVLLPAGETQAEFDTLLEWTRQVEIDGQPVAKDPTIRHKIARLAIEMEVCRVLELRILAATCKGIPCDIEAAEHKLYVSHLEQRIADTALDIMGAYGLLRNGSKHLMAEGFFEHLYRASIIRTIGGGSSEIQKNIIARRLLGLRG